MATPTEAEQIRILHDLLRNRGPDDEPPPDPTTLDPARFSERWRIVALSLHAGASPADVWKSLSPALAAELNAIDPTRPPPKLPEPGEFYDDLAPELPKAAQIDRDLARIGSPWLDRYMAFSAQWSPRAYDGFHEDIGLWLLSSVAARRVSVHCGPQHFTNLYIALVARTSVWAKSTTVDIGIATLRAAGLDWLLASDDATPQKFISDLTLTVPSYYDQLDGEARERARLRLAFAGKRGWFYEEFGQKISAMMAPNGFMADFRGILRRLDDCPEDYSYGSIGRGTDIVPGPYIALLANMTPADLQKSAGRGNAMWGDGFWARFALVAPPMGANPGRGRFPKAKRVIPAELITPLRAWHDRLRQHDVVVEDMRDDDGKLTGQKRAILTQTTFTPCTLEESVTEAFYAYHDALIDLLRGGDNQDLDGNYSRFASKALRIATLLASLEDCEVVQEKHWARAQLITERWRGCLHSLYAQVNAPPPSKTAELEDKVVEIVHKLYSRTSEDPTAADVARYIRGESSKEIANVLDGLVYAGKLEDTGKTTRGTRRYHLPS
jgi:hypothetical protein